MPQLDELLFKLRELSFRQHISAVLMNWYGAHSLKLELNLVKMNLRTFTHGHH